MTTKLMLASMVAAFALAGSLVAPGNAFAGVTDRKADVLPAPSCADDGKRAAMQSNADDSKPAATQSNANPDQKEKTRNRGFDWQSYRDRYEPDYRRHRGYDWQSYRDRYEPDYRRYLDHGWSYEDRRRRHRNDDD